MNQRIRRRSFVTAAGLSVGFATAGGASILESTRALANTARRPTSVIFVTLGGGPSQYETFDPKPDAPAEIRGDFRAISTRIPGVAFCELLPKLAQVADKLAVVRSVHHEQASHIAEHIVETGYDLRPGSNTRVGDMPSQGAAISKLRGSGANGIPAYVSLPRHHGYSSPHWLGARHHFFAVDDDPNQDGFKVSNLALAANLTIDRLKERRNLQHSLEQQRAVSQSSAATNEAREAADPFANQAFDLVAGDKARSAFQIQSEPDDVRDRYGRNPLGQRMLLARRLVEAEVPFVVVRMFDWDDHQDLAKLISARAPLFDTALSSLVSDLNERGLDRDVLVVAMGEFGRTPRVNAMRGRDHYPAVNVALFAGGGLQMGQVVGGTDRHGLQVAHSPYRPQNVLAMVYRHLGIDPATTFPDFSGRPRHLLEERRPIRELLG